MERAAFARYLLAGVASFTVDFSLYTLLATALGADPLLANAISRPVGGLTCFFINRSWTFNAAGRNPFPLQILRFWCVFGASLLLTEGLIALFCKGWGLSAVPGKALAETIAVGFNFMALKYWTFR
jgi:putative flippase GtrA